MADNLRITTPISTNSSPNDSLSKVRPTTKESSAINVLDPTKLDPIHVSSKNYGENTTKEDNLFSSLLNQNSSISKFLEQLKNTPGLSQTLKKVVYDTFLRAQSLGETTSFEEVLKNLSEAMKMDKQQILDTLKFQHNNQTKFSNRIFSFLSALSQGSNNKEFKEILGSFLKSYNGYFSTSQTMSLIDINLNDIMKMMPNSYKNQLNEIYDLIKFDDVFKNLNENLSVLKEKIIPFLSQYITKTNDFGKVRDTITLLINNIAMLNVSSLGDYADSLESLIDFLRFNFNIPNDKLLIIKNKFTNEFLSTETKGNKLFDSLIETIMEGLKNDKSSQSRSIFRDISNALLLDNSVFMPLNHMVLPLNYNGKFMFSEIWVDKDDKSSSDDTEYVSKTKLFITFDIKDLGYFEAEILLLDKKATVELNYPEELKGKERDIRLNMIKILEKNSFSVDRLSLVKAAPQKQLHKVFKNLYERKRTIDVTV